MKKPPAAGSRAGALSTSISTNFANAGLIEATSPAQVHSSLAVFAERASARAILASEGVIDKIEAVDALQRAAVEQRLVEIYGQDRVQQILADAFKMVEERRWSN
jgi:hypothetical protein